MRPGRRKTLTLVGIGAGAAAGGALVGALLRQSHSGAAALLSASFSDLDGRPRRLLDWQGRPLVCNFWATWCAPCREEVPLLISAKQQYAETDLEVVGISVDSADKVREFATIYRVNYPLLVAGADAIDLMRTMGNKAGALPYTVLLDRHGGLAGSKLGAYSRPELQAALTSLLG
jgi:thiol-disulfide isomerase/thioredoxin